MKTDSTSAPPTWVFARGGDHVRIQLVKPTRLLVSTPGDEMQEHDFDTADALLQFQLDYEQHLSADGWTFVEFSPERRSRRDRRKTPRFSEERRRRP